MFISLLGYISFIVLLYYLNRQELLLMVPVAVNLGLMITFTATLWHPPSIAERIARKTSPEITTEQSHYCRQVTLVWSIFFFFNGLIALIAGYFSLEFWTLYTGLIGYLLIGLLFIGEMTYRYWRFRVYVGAPGETILKKLFPPTKGTNQ